MSKLQLKAARDAIAQKNFDYAEQLCEDILELDPEHYTALVFSGLALKELERFEESKQRYEKAIKIQPGQILAFQGMLKLLETTNDKQGQVHIYQQLCRFYLESYISID
jgi:tetratricopeptide (TPR) repeat protein